MIKARDLVKVTIIVFVEFDKADQNLNQNRDKLWFYCIGEPNQPWIMFKVFFSEISWIFSAINGNSTNLNLNLLSSVLVYLRRRLTFNEWNMDMVYSPQMRVYYIYSRSIAYTVIWRICRIVSFLFRCFRYLRICLMQYKMLIENCVSRIRRGGFESMCGKDNFSIFIKVSVYTQNPEAIIYALKILNNCGRRISSPYWINDFVASVRFLFSWLELFSVCRWQSLGLIDRVYYVN